MSLLNNAHLTLLLLFQLILVTNSMMEDSGDEGDSGRSSILAPISEDDLGEDSVNSFSSSFPGTPRASHNRDVQRYNYDSEDSSDSSVSDSGFGGSRSFPSRGMCQKNWACLDSEFQCMGSNQHECEFSWTGEPTISPIEININSIEIELSSGHVIDQELGGGILGIFGSTVEEVTLPSPRLSKVEIQCAPQSRHGSVS